MSKTKKRVLAGMRASGRLHVGNYYGGAKGMVALQENPEYETFYMVANLHGITTPFKPSELRQNTREVVLDYLAAGLDPDKSAIFIQSELPHAELSFLLSSTMTVARMQHLPTFKEKIKQHPDNVTMALLNYPVLMAADILLYKAHLVPVGLDQDPHIEVAREIARKMNDQYGMDFPEPERFSIKGGEYIPSLAGEGKMSKSVEGSYISLTDSPDDIRSKLASAPTDSGKGEKVPKEGGVANLLHFVELFEGLEKRRKYEEMYLSTGIKYSQLKADLGDAIYDVLKPIQERRKIFEKDTSMIDRILSDGAERAREVASQTVKEVKEKMGLI